MSDSAVRKVRPATKSRPAATWEVMIGNEEICIVYNEYSAVAIQQMEEHIASCQVALAELRRQIRAERHDRHGRFMRDHGKY